MMNSNMGWRITLVLVLQWYLSMTAVAQSSTTSPKVNLSSSFSSNSPGTNTCTILPTTSFTTMKTTKLPTTLITKSSSNAAGKTQATTAPTHVLATITSKTGPVPAISALLSSSKTTTTQLPNTNTPLVVSIEISRKSTLFLTSVISKSITLDSSPNNTVMTSLSTVVPTKIQNQPETSVTLPAGSVQKTLMISASFKTTDQATGKTTSILSSPQPQTVTSVISEQPHVNSTVQDSMPISPSTSQVPHVSTVIKKYVSILSKITLKNATFVPELEDPRSAKYIELENECKVGLKEIYQNIIGFRAVTAIVFSEGSVVVNYKVVFNTNEDPENIRQEMNKALKNIKVGSFSIDYDPSDTKVAGASTSEPQPEPEPDLPEWAFYTLIGCGCLLLILIFIIIYLCVKLRRHKKYGGSMPSFMEVFSNEGADKMDLWDNKIRAKQVSTNGHEDTSMKELNGNRNKIATTWYSEGNHEMTEEKDHETPSPQLKSFYINQQDNQDTGL